HVVLADNYTWQRNMGNINASASSFDPGRSLHLETFDGFFNRLTRFYLTGAPNPGNFNYMPGAYDMWVDQIELYHEDDALTAAPRVARTASNVLTNVVLTN